MRRWVLAALALGCSAGALAQGTHGTIAPIEVLTCRFAAGQGPAGLTELAAGFNAWMAQTQAPEQAAYVLLPLAHSEEIDFDLAWVGAWADGVAMGRSMAHSHAEGAPLGALFDGLMQCGSNRNFSVVTLQEPVAPGRFGPLEATTCTLRLGASLDAALQAVSDWVDFTVTTGSTAAHWLLFPAYGERSDADYAFKWTVGYESFESFGRDYEQLTNGNGLDRYQELLDPHVRCDSPRLYDVRPIRPPRD